MRPTCPRNLADVRPPVLIFTLVCTAKTEFTLHSQTRVNKQLKMALTSYPLARAISWHFWILLCISEPKLLLSTFHNHSFRHQSIFAHIHDPSHCFPISLSLAIFSLRLGHFDLVGRELGTLGPSPPTRPVPTHLSSVHDTEQWILGLHTSTIPPYTTIALFNSRWHLFISLRPFTYSISRTKDQLSKPYLIPLPPTWLA